MLCFLPNSKETCERKIQLINSRVIVQVVENKLNNILEQIS